MQLPDTQTSAAEWVACPRCGREGYHEHHVDTGQIPGKNGAMIDVHDLGKVYPNVTWRCLVCGHNWWTRQGESDD